jgi:hypothetical protein
MLQHTWLSLALYAHTKNLAIYSTKNTLVVTETMAHKSMGSHSKPVCLSSAQVNTTGTLSYIVKHLASDITKPITSHLLTAVGTDG